MKKSVSDRFLSIRSELHLFVLNARFRILAGLLPVIGVFVIGIVVLVAYHPDLNVGYWREDYGRLQDAGVRSWSDYLVWSLDRRVQTQEYRPAGSLFWKIQYAFLGSNALWYHVVQNIIHLFNCVLLFAIIGRLGRNWRMGLVGALIYAVLPVSSNSVFWVSVDDLRAAFFYLLAIWLWVDYLEKGSRAKLVLTFVSFVMGLASKEIVFTLPVTLLLVDRWLVAKPAQWRDWVARNAMFFLVLLFWALVEWNVLASKLAIVEPRHADWGAVISNLASYVVALTFPWDTDSAVRYLSALAYLGLITYALVTRKYRLLFVGVMGPLSVLPMAGALGVESRYLYLPLMVSAAGIGIIVESAHKLIRLHASKRAFALFACSTLALVVAVLTVSESKGTAEAAESFGTHASQERLEFRPIFQRHPAFAADTLLYFVEPPMPTPFLSGMMFLRYGANVIVEGNEYAGLAGLRQHQAAYFFYQDDQGIMREQLVDKEAVATVKPALPVQFGPSLKLDGFEVVNTLAKPDQAIILLLYWRAQGRIDKDYTVFGHLLDKNGAIVSSHDSLPLRGIWPMTRWPAGTLVEDAIILPISSDVPAGREYRVEVGLYYLPTMDRLLLLDWNQESGGDSVIFESFAVER